MKIGVRALFRIFAGVAFFGFLSACGSEYLRKSSLHEPNSQHEAGTTDVAIVYVEPWDQVVSDLAPNFQISGPSALQMVIPQTTEEVNRILDALSLKFGLGFQAKTLTRVETQTQNTGEAAQTQSTTTQQTQAGKATEPSTTSPAGARTIKDLPGTDVFAKPNGQDPLLQHVAALALLQEVRLLNRYVLGAAKRSDFTPYLVRLQISQMPRARYQPYDSYTTLSFFTTHDPDGDNNAALKLRVQQVETSGKGKNKVLQPIVIPLVVTDALEGGLTSNSVEVVRQLAMTLNAVVDNAEAKAELQRLQDAVNSITGVNLNSLQTIGRMNDNGVRIRLGAVRSPIAKDAYVMVPRTHYATILVLAPNSWLEEGEKNKSPSIINVAGRTRFVHATKGTTLPIVHGSALYDELAGLANMYILKNDLPDLTISPECPMADIGEEFSTADSKGKGAPDKKKLILLRYLIDRVEENNYYCFTATLAKNYPEKADAPYLWNELAALSTSYGFSGTKFQLPMEPKQRPPHDQTIILSDDGKGAATGSISGGSRVIAERISAVLKINDGKADFNLASQSVSFSGSSLQISFPSPKKLSIELGDGARGEVKLVQKGDPWGDANTETVTTYQAYIKQVNAAPDAGMKLETAISALPMKQDNTGQVSIFLTFADGKDKKAVSARVSLSGGEVRGAAIANGSPGKTTLASGVAKVDAVQGDRVELILSLANLIDGGSLQIRASAGNPSVEVPPTNVAVKSQSGQQAGQKPTAN